MPRVARSASIDPRTPQIVHVWNRCVRRAFLCGADAVLGKNYEHRRQWARDRLEHLAKCFAVDVITFAIMSNHSHQILRSRPDVAATWDDRTVAIRWLSINARCDDAGEPKAPSEPKIQQIVGNPKLLAEIRLRLSDISWWMRSFAHNIAVRANKEDNVTGHFWESRFSHQVITQKADLLTCMIYVDLNPIRANMAQTPEESDFTGAKERIDDLRIRLLQDEAGQWKLSSTEPVSSHLWERLESATNQFSGWLSPIEIDEATDPIGADPDPGFRRASCKGVLTMPATRYLELLDWCGRQIRSDKRGEIAANLAPLLGRLGIDSGSLLKAVLATGSKLGRSFQTATAATNLPSRTIDTKVGVL